MKSRSLNALLLGILVFGMPCVGAADPYTWVDRVDSDSLVDHWRRLDYTHNIIDNGFVVGEDTITSYILELRLVDDKDDSRWELCELAWVDQPGLSGDGFYTSFNYSSQTYGWSFAGLAQLNAYGTLTVRIHSLMGDFNFDWSELSASGQNNTAPVPEPATMLLMGAGLIGLGIMRRFQKPGK